MSRRSSSNNGSLDTAPVLSSALLQRYKELCYNGGITKVELIQLILVKCP